MPRRLICCGGATRLFFFAVNKIDGDKQELTSNEFYALGLDSIFPISAAHGRGVSELLDTVIETLLEQEETPSPAVLDAATPGAKPDLRLAIIGRPNVGKSSLLNCLVGVERSIVDSTPGTTRDAVDSWLVWQDKRILLVDTAGVRRRTRIHEHIEQASALIALKALERAEIGLLVFDAQEGLTDQDARLIRYTWERGRGIVLVVNKWDLIPSDRKKSAAVRTGATRGVPGHAAAADCFSVRPDRLTGKTFAAHRHPRGPGVSHRDSDSGLESGVYRVDYPPPGSHLSSQAGTLLLRHPSRNQAAQNCRVHQLAGWRPGPLRTVFGESTQRRV